MYPNLVTYHVHKNNPLPANDALAYQYILAGNGVFIRSNGPHVPRLRGGRQFLFRPCSCQAMCHSWPRPTQIPLLPARSQTAVHPIAICPGRCKTYLRPHNERILHEVLYHFHHLGQTVQVKKRPQQATATTVQSEGDGGTDVICDLHSHGRMPPFWSDTDNKDELGARLYAVIGRVDSDQPEIQLRAERDSGRPDASRP